MTAQQILNKLKDTTLDAHDRERLLQHLHYLTVENIQTSAKRPTQKNKPKRK